MKPARTSRRYRTPMLPCLCAWGLLLPAVGRLPVRAEDGEDGASVRPAAVAGAFYPGAGTRLAGAVERMLADVPAVAPAGEIVAAVAPHAGYVYSGGVAAYTHKLLSNAVFDTVVIIGHDCHVPGAVAFVSPLDYFETPLGRVAVDTEMVRGLIKQHPGIVSDTRIHGREHTVEVQLPFLQVLHEGCRIVPVLFGTPSHEHCRILAEAIEEVAGERRVLVLASTDLSHYPSHGDAARIDEQTLKLLPGLDVKKLFAHLDKVEKGGKVPNLSTCMCARGGVGTAMLFARARGANHVQLLRYANSGDVPAGNRRRVVGYGAAALVRRALDD